MKNNTKSHYFFKNLAVQISSIHIIMDLKIKLERVSKNSGTPIISTAKMNFGFTVRGPCSSRVVVVNIITTWEPHVSQISISKACVCNSRNDKLAYHKCTFNRC